LGILIDSRDLRKKERVHKSIRKTRSKGCGGGNPEGKVEKYARRKRKNKVLGKH